MSFLLSPPRLPFAELPPPCRRLLCHPVTSQEDVTAFKKATLQAYSVTGFLGQLSLKTLISQGSALDNFSVTCDLKSAVPEEGAMQLLTHLTPGFCPLAGNVTVRHLPKKRFIMCHQTGLF